MIEKSNVYVLFSKNRQMVKIGKANSMIVRYNSLELTWGEFDIDKSFSIECDSAYVFKLEKALHNLFEQFNIKENLEYKDGFSEFFHVDSYDSIVELVNLLVKFNKSLTIKKLEKEEIPVNTNQKMKFGIVFDKPFFEEFFSNFKNFKRDQHDNNLLVVSINSKILQQKLNLDNHNYGRFLKLYNPKIIRDKRFFYEIRKNNTLDTIEFIISEMDILSALCSDLYTKRLKNVFRQMQKFFDNNLENSIKENSCLQNLISNGKELFKNTSNIKCDYEFEFVLENKNINVDKDLNLKQFNYYFRSLFSVNNVIDFYRITSLSSISFDTRYYEELFLNKNKKQLFEDKYRNTLFNLLLNN